MKLVGAILFVVGLLLFLASLAPGGSTNLSLWGCLLMPGGILVGYLLARKPNS